MTAKGEKQRKEQFDTRVIDQKLRRGEVTPEEYSAYLKKLQDDEGNAEYLVLADESSAEESSTGGGTPTFTSA